MKQNDDPALIALAEEELAMANSMPWSVLSRVTPWGDAYDGFAVGDRPVRIERNYLWNGPEGGDILIEVAVFADESRRKSGVSLCCVVSKP